MVDVKKTTWTNTIGVTELIAVWKNPEFDPTQRAFYYGRLLEIPTPRWTAYNAKFYQLKDPDPNLPMITQERAYTSPISADMIYNVPLRRIDAYHQAGLIVRTDEPIVLVQRMPHLEPTRFLHRCMKSSRR